MGTVERLGHLGDLPGQAGDRAADPVLETGEAAQPAGQDETVERRAQGTGDQQDIGDQRHGSALS